MKKLVSVIIPTYGGGEYLDRTLDSVLAQTYPCIEIIVVDDNGIETENQRKTKSVMDHYKHNSSVIYVCHKVNRNGSTARNTGFAHSTGDYICLLDDDDEYTPEKIERQVDALEQHMEYGLTYCSREMYINGKLSGKKRALPSDNYLFDLVTHRLGISSGTLMVRRNVWQKVNGFDESLQRHQDYEFTARVASSFKILPLDFIGLKKNMTGRNNPKSFRKTFDNRRLYMEKIEPLTSHFTKEEQRKVIESNYLSIAMKALFHGDCSTCIDIYRYVKPGLEGITYIFKYVTKAVKSRKR